MQKITILFSFIFFIFSEKNAQGQPPDCARFKEGKYRIADPRAGGIVIADRRGDYQTETSEALKAVVRFRITWTDNCSFVLRLDKVLRNENKINFPSNMTITIKITATGNNSYTQETTSSLVNGTYKTAVTRVD